MKNEKFENNILIKEQDPGQFWSAKIRCQSVL